MRQGFEIGYAQGKQEPLRIDVEGIAAKVTPSALSASIVPRFFRSTAVVPCDDRRTPPRAERASFFSLVRSRGGWGSAFHRQWNMLAI